MIKIIIPGKVFPKERPRAIIYQGKIRMYTPPKTIRYENFLRKKLQEYSNSFCTLKTVAVKLKIYIYIAQAKTNNQKECIVKPDIDNFLKMVLDAMNGISYQDDKQVVEVMCYKRYDKEERLEIEIEYEVNK